MIFAAVADLPRLSYVTILIVRANSLISQWKKLPISSLMRCLLFYIKQCKCKDYHDCKWICSISLSISSENLSKLLKLKDLLFYFNYYFKSDALSTILHQTV